MSQAIDLMTYKATIKLDDKDFNTGLTNADNGFNKFKSTVGNVGGAITKTLGVGLAVAGTALTAFGIKGVKLASDLQEVQNVVDTTFGDKANKINEWAKNASTAFGMSELSAKKFNGTMGAMLKSSGITGDKLSDMSTKLTGLAGDFASFYNLDSEEAFQKLRAGISGETEPLKQLGINLSAVAVEEKALSMGLGTRATKMKKVKVGEDEAKKSISEYKDKIKGLQDEQRKLTAITDSSGKKTNEYKQKIFDAKQGIANYSKAISDVKNGIQTTNIAVSEGKVELTEQEKVLARYALILEKGSDAQGDFTKTSDSLANQMRIASLKVEDLSAKFGTMLMPVVNNALTGILSLAEKSMPAFDNLFSGFVGLLTNVEGAEKQFQVGAESILNSLVKNISEIVPKAISVLSNLLPAIMKFGIDLIAQLALGIANALPMLIPTAIDAIFKFADTLANNMDAIVNSGLDMINKLSEGITKALPIIEAKAPEIVDKLIDGFVKNFPKCYAAGWGFTLEIGKGMLGAFASNATIIPIKIFEFVESMLKSLGAYISQTLTAGWNSIVTFFTGTIPSFINNVVIWFNDLPTKIGEAVGRIIGHFIKFGINAGNWIMIDLPLIINGIINWFAKLPSRIGDKFMEIVTGLGKWGSDMIDTASVEIPKFIDGFINFFSELPKKMLDIGVNVVKGLWDGICSMGSWIADQMSGFFTGMVDGIKETLGIHSPSTVFADIGDNMAQGLGIGFEKTMKYVAKDINKTIPTGFNVTSNLIKSGQPTTGTNTIPKGSNNISAQPIQLTYHAGDIIVHGNASQNTIDQIRQIAKEQVDKFSKEIALTFETLPSQALQKAYRR